MNSPLISVIMPCYNHGLYILQAVNSIYSQTHKNIEIIIIDDGSTDIMTLDTLLELERKGLTILRSQRIYPAAARNIGFKRSIGDYILTLDADDLFDTFFIEKALKILNENSHVGAVSSWTMGFGYNDFLWKPLGGGLENFIHRINCSVSAIIRRNVWEDINGFDESYRDGFEDWEFWIRVTKSGYSIHIIPEILFFYRQKKNSRVQETNLLHGMIHNQIMKKHRDIYINIFPHIFTNL